VLLLQTWQKETSFAIPKFCWSSRSCIWFRIRALDFAFDNTDVLSCVNMYSFCWTTCNHDLMHLFRCVCFCSTCYKLDLFFNLKICVYVHVCAFVWLAMTLTFSNLNAHVFLLMMCFHSTCYNTNLFFYLNVFVFVHFGPRLEFNTLKVTMVDFERAYYFWEWHRWWYDNRLRF
jgi:hypothetical protein